MNGEVVLAVGYGAFLVAGAFVLEWLSAHTHRRALRYRTAGFTYDQRRDAWRCPEGQDLWPHELDRERRLVRYRAKAHICNGCPRKDDCTDSDTGREVVRPLDPWPHSEAGRFHRGLSIMMVALACLLVVAELIRHHRPLEALALGALLIVIMLATRWLVRDFRHHPAGFPASASLPRLVRSSGSEARPASRSRWASDNRMTRSTE